MRLEYLREFIVLADLCNFTKAVDQLFITQSALTRHIASLESELGVRLLDRTTRGVAITPMGRRCYQVFSDMLARYDGLLGDVQGYLSGLEGTLRLGMLYYCITDYVTPATTAFAAAYPKIGIKLESGQPKDIERWLRDNVIDVGLQTQYPGTTDDEFGFIEVDRHPYVALVPHSHPLADRSVVAVSDIASETIVVYGQDKPITDCIFTALEKSGITPQRTFDAGQVDATPLAVMQHGAVALMAANLRSTYPGLATVDVADETMRASVGYAYRRSNDNPALAAFLQTVTQTLGGAK